MESQILIELEQIITELGTEFGRTTIIPDLKKRKVIELLNKFAKPEQWYSREGRLQIDPKGFLQQIDNLLRCKFSGHPFYTVKNANDNEGGNLWSWWYLFVEEHLWDTLKKGKQSGVIRILSFNGGGIKQFIAAQFFWFILNEINRLLPRHIKSPHIKEKKDENDEDPEKETMEKMVISPDAGISNASSHNPSESSRCDDLSDEGNLSDGSEENEDDETLDLQNTVGASNRRAKKLRELKDEVLQGILREYQKMILENAIYELEPHEIFIVRQLLADRKERDIAYDLKISKSRFSQVKSGIIEKLKITLTTLGYNKIDFIPEGR